MEVRQAHHGDLNGLVSVAMACGRSRRAWAGNDWTPPVLLAERRLWWERLKDDRTWVAVASAGVTVIGAIALWEARSEKELGYRIGYLGGPYVDPDWWGEGVGRELFAQSIAVARRLRFARVEVVVEAGNQRARSILKSGGWRSPDRGPKRSQMDLVLYGQAVA